MMRDYEQSMKGKTGFSEKGEFDFGPKGISPLVRYLYDPGVIGRQQFAKLAIVGERLKRNGLKDIPENRGLVLRGVVEEVVEKRLALTPNNIRAKMLHEMISLYKTREELADIFAMSHRTVHRYVAQAYSILGGCLMSTQLEAIRKLVDSSTYPKSTNLVEPVAKEPQSEDYAQYLKRLHPDWTERKTAERVAITDEVLNDLSGFMAQQRKAMLDKKP